MDIEENKRIVREFTERMGKGDSAVLDELTTDDFVVHVLFDKGSNIGRDVYKQTNDGAHVSFPDYAMSVDDMIAEGDKVMALSTIRGTHTGAWDIPPTGIEVQKSRFTLFRLENGKIAETWNMDDYLGEFQQLGVISTIPDTIQAYKDSLK